MCNKHNNIQINIKITEIVLTPLTCAVLINEIIKFLVYQKSQIPYPFNWLQNVVSRRRKRTTSEESNLKNNNFSVERHFTVVSTAFDAMDEIMKNIKLEFSTCAKFIKEVLIIFGATPFTPKEVFRINIPFIDENHIESNHSNSTQKNQHKVLRNLFLCQDWIKAMDRSCPTTNMYVMLKKCKDGSINKENSFFLPIRDFSVPINSLSVTINLEYKNNSDHICCSNLTVYSENSSNNHCKTDNEKISTPLDLDDCWYQGKILVKGYKDCFINKVSVSELF